MPDKSDTWSNASKWIMGGLAAVVAVAIFTGANFVAGAVWEKVKHNISIEVLAQTTESVDAKIKILAEENEKTRQELLNVQTTQRVQIKETGDLKEAVKVNSVIGNKILKLLETQQ